MKKKYIADVCLILFVVIQVLGCSKSEKKIKPEMNGLWALESNSSNDFSYLIIEKITKEKALILIVDLKDPSINNRYIGEIKSENRIIYTDPFGLKRELELKGDVITENHIGVLLPEYFPAVYTKLKPEEMDW